MILLRPFKQLIRRLRQFRRNTFPTAAERRIDGYNFAVEFCKEEGFTRGISFLKHSIDQPPATPFEEGIHLFLYPGDDPCVTTRLKRFS